MADLLTSRRAEEEVREIWRYIAAENPAAADRLLLRIDDKLQLLRDFPGIGTLRDDIRPGLRMLVENNYLLLYEHDDQPRSGADLRYRRPKGPEHAVLNR